MRPAWRLAGSRGMVSLSAAVQITGFCACEFAAKAQTSSAAKMEKFLILEVLLGSGSYASQFASGGLRRYRVDAITRGYRLRHEVRPEVSSFVLLGVALVPLGLGCKGRVA